MSTVFIGAKYVSSSTPSSIGDVKRDRKDGKGAANEGADGEESSNIGSKEEELMMAAEGPGGRRTLEVAAES